MRVESITRLPLGPEKQPKSTAKAAASGDSLKDYELIKRSVRFLTRSWREQPSLDDLAGHLGLSPAHCQRLFKRWCGLSPKEFMGAIAIDHARQLLQDSASVLDASLQSGLSGAGRLHDLFVSHEAMTPGDYKRRGAGLEMAYGYHATPFGEALVMATKRGLAGLAFVEGEKGGSREVVLAEMMHRWPASQFVEAPERTAPHVVKIFASAANVGGEQHVRLVLIGTDFEVRVWETLLKIPVGRAVSYGDIARHIGHPTASRAVGTAVGRNPISFVVPCHRVMRADGGLGGYHWGVTRKRAIIGWETGQLAAHG
jgi:AraC family transcriptional regulator of adaptative response/methylated-DNA-[protein]-cysteine methyltransferase